MNMHFFRTLAGLSVAGTLAAGTGLAQAQQQQQQYVQARVISATPVRESTGSDVSYNVTYEYNGRTYSTRMNTRPGATIPIQANGYGVTTAPVTPQPQIQPYPVEADGGQTYGTDNGGAPWDNVVPEPGVVVGSGPAPVYAQAPVYVDPGYGYGYGGYGYPYFYPPIGLSLNLGYSRGGYYRGGGFRGYGGFRGGGFHGGGFHGGGFHGGGFHR